MNLNLEGVRVLITGGSRGIGFATANAFAQAGAHVSICARDPDQIEVARKALAKHGGKVHAACCDMADADAIRAYVDEAAAALGGIDVLVNNAGGKASGNTDDDWIRSIDIDLMATVRTIAAARPYLAKSDRARIINISSRTAFRPSPDTQPYGALKAALHQLTQSQAAELAADGINVNCIAPGSTDFPGSWWDQCRTDNPELYKKTMESFPFGRIGREDDITGPILFLSSSLAGWITGQTILVDGGQTLNG